MKKYKALISDFDMTLVGYDLRVTPEIKEAIKSLVDRGYIFTIATARHFHSVIRESIRELGIGGLHIMRGGAEIIDAETEKIIWSKYISQFTSEKLLDFLTNNNILFTAEKDEYIYTKSGEHFSPYCRFSRFKKMETLKPDKISVFRVFLYDPTEKDLMIEDVLLSRFDNISIIRSKSTLKEIVIDITAKQATKLHALNYLFTVLGIKKQDAIGVGDGYNDYPLLSGCGLKIAMGNANTDLKKIADYIAPNQDNQGLVTIIRRYFS